MTVCEAIALSDSLCPNCLDRSLKLRWLSEAEGTVSTRITGLPIIPYGENTDPDTVLAVAYPFDMIYRHYLTAQIALAHGEYDRYNNSIILYNTALAAYGSYFRRINGADDRGQWKLA